MVGYFHTSKEWSKYEKDGTDRNNVGNGIEYTKCTKQSPCLISGTQNMQAYRPKGL